MIDSSERLRSEDVEVERMYAQVRRGLFGATPEPIVVGRYEILERVGAGATGFVYAGRDAQLGRKVAIKLMRPDGMGRGHGSRGRARLLREAQAMAQVSSPFAVTVYEAGTHGEQVYVAMEYVDGRTLSAWLVERRRGWREICELFADAGRGLAAVHAAGLVHRDFKPDNVLIGSDDRPRVADFGLAAAVGHREPPSSAASSMSAAAMDARLTRTGVAAGSLAYMSPEQHRRESVDARSDQFGFCVALFEALHSVRPFAGASEDELRGSVLAGAIEWPPAGPRLPKRLQRLLARGLDAEPARRFASMDAVVRELERTLRRNRVWGLGVAAVAGGALFAAFSGAFADPEEAGPCVQRQGEAWGDAERERLATALRGTDAPSADATAAQVVARLDDHAAQWTAIRDETCAVPTGSEHELLALACLDRSLGEMHALADALVDDPARRIDHAMLAAYKLRDPSICRDEPSAALHGARDIDPASVAARGQVWAAIDEATVRLNTGDWEGGLLRAQHAVELARATDDDALTAEAMFLRGMLASRLDRDAEAEHDLFEASVIAERAGDWDVLARARTELVVVVGYRQGRTDEAAVWSSLARAALDRHGRRGLVEVRLLNAEGLVARQRDDLATARRRFAEALRLARDVLPEQHPGLASTLENLAQLDAEQGRLAAAAARLDEALAIRHATLGDAHPDTRRTAQALADLRAR